MVLWFIKLLVEQTNYLFSVQNSNHFPKWLALLAIIRENTRIVKSMQKSVTIPTKFAVWASIASSLGSQEGGGEREPGDEARASMATSCVASCPK